MSRPHVGLIAATAAILLGGCHSSRAAVPPLAAPPPSALIPASTNSDPGAQAAAMKRACESFVISVKAMSIKQHWFTKRHPVIDYGDLGVQSDIETMNRSSTIWIRSLQSDLSPDLPADVRAKIEAYIVTSQNKIVAYTKEYPATELNSTLEKDNAALHEAGRACGTE